MPMMMKDVLGLDLGTHSLKAVELHQTLRGLEPEQLRMQPRQTPGQEPSGAAPLVEELRRFVAENELPTEYVACALPGEQLSSRRLSFPFRDAKRLAQAVPFEVEGEIPFELEDVLVDWQVVRDDRTRAEVTAVIAQRQGVADLIETLAEAGCAPRVIEADGFVLANLTAIFDLPGNRLLADIGHTSTSFCLLMDGRAVAARTIAVGGAAITEAIARDRSLSREEAERIKCEEGIFHLGFNSSSPGALAIVDRIAREALRTVESLDSVLGAAPTPPRPAAELLSDAPPVPVESDAGSEARGSTSVTITLLGGSARLHRLDEYLAERTGLPTSRLALPESPEGQALVAGGDPLVFAPAIALALRGTASAVTRMNFRKDQFAYRTDLRSLFGPEIRWTAGLAAASLLLLAISVTTSIVLDNRRADQLERQVASIYAEAFPDAPGPSNPIAAMRSAGVEARERADFLGVYGGNRSALDLLGELSRRIPADLEVKFEEVSIDRNKVHVKVFSKSFEAADRITSELAASEAFRNAKVSGEIKTDRKRQGKVFNLSIPLDLPGGTS